MVEKVKKAFSKVVVVLNVGGVVDTEWIKNDPDICSCLLAWQGGMEGGLAEAEILMGIGYPSGKLADTFAKRIEDYPSTEGFYESEDYVEYTEDIYVGYRYFETLPGAGDKVNYPFGYGMSYTEFEIDNLELETRVDGTGDVTVRLDVTNIGTRPGKEVIQVYYSAPQGILGKPAMALGAYKKTRELAPGETTRIEISYPVNYMASYDDTGKVEKSSYILEQGEYTIFVGNSVRNVVEAGALELDDNVLVERLSEKLKPVRLKKRMRPDGSFEPLETEKWAEESEKNEQDEDYPAEIDGTVGYSPAYRAVPRQKLWDEKGKPKFIDVAEGRISLDEFVAELPDETLADLLGGQPNTGVANCFGIGNLPEYGVPNAMTADGPAGLRILPEVGVCTTAFPSATLLACTWNPEVTYRVGVAAGEEVKENNLAVWLAPAVNIHRNPLCGRNFEYYSEDPVLAGKQAAALVMGVQSNNIGVSLKHFALNNKETNRFHSDSRVSERAAREIYLKPFEIVVKEADPWTVMSSYNRINGVRASENRDLLTGILKGEWNYEGMVTTDWWNYASHYKEVMAGNDIKMGTGYPEQLIRAVREGLINRENLEDSAKRILAMLLKLD
jgi:beta-glucosidase